MDGLLAGTRVLDLGIWRPVPYATALLAQLGADVLKVEPPGGDPMRQFPQLFDELNAHKRSVELNLRDPEQRARALSLAAEADVVTEGFRPGVAARLGVGWDAVHAVNPAAVYCSISGYGQEGPLAALPGHDLNYQAYAGMVAPEPGDEPVPARAPVGDLAGGLAAAFAICAALVRATRTGRGERIDLAMTDVLATWTGTYSGGLTFTGSDQPMRGTAAYGCYSTADGHTITLGIITENHFWAALCDVLGFDDVRDLGIAERQGRTDELRARVTEACAARTRDELVASLGAAGVPVSPVLSRAEMAAHPHFRQRGIVADGPDGTPVAGHPVCYASERPRGPARAPKLDEHAGQGFHEREADS